MGSTQNCHSVTFPVTWTCVRACSVLLHRPPIAASENIMRIVNEVDPLLLPSPGAPFYGSQVRIAAVLLQIRDAHQHVTAPPAEPPQLW